MRFLVAAALIACKSRSSPPPPSPAPIPSAVDASTLDARVGPSLPGALYFLHEEALVKLAGGTFVTAFTDPGGAPIFPSAFALPDGRIVGIASKGTGEPGSEQLVLIGPDLKVERIGPAITQVRSPAVDPAGKWIVIEAKLEPHSELYRIDLATQESTQLTKNLEGNFTPAVLDATSIVFASSRDGDSEIYKLDLATKKPTRLTAFHKDDWSPYPSPDGKSIAFTSDREGSQHIFLVDADGTHVRRLTTATADEDEPAWSPDGKSIALVRDGKLVVREVAAGTERVFTPADSSDGEPSWSPDGQWIAVTRARKATTYIVAVSLAPGALPVTVASQARLPRWH